MSRTARAAIARQTQAIVAAGRYDRDGRAVDIGAWVAAARRGSHLHLPDDPVLDLAGAFDRVTFAVLDRSPGAPTLGAFEDRVRGVSLA